MYLTKTRKTFLQKTLIEVSCNKLKIYAVLHCFFFLEHFYYPLICLIYLNITSLKKQIERRFLQKKLYQ